MTLTEKAFAKINLFLDVTGRLDNGYHTVNSLMQSVSLYDTVSAEMLPLSADGRTIKLTCSDPTLPCDGTNLAARAAVRFFEALSLSEYAVSIHIEKRIPMAAGLAGGSADCAAVLRLLNRLYGEPFCTDELYSIGATLGADVPFCVTGGTAVCQGIGEILTPVRSNARLTLLLAVGGEGVSTPMAYSLIDSAFEGRLSEPHGNIDRMLSAAVSGDPSRVGGALYNIFEEVILPIRPVARQLKEELLSAGAMAALMSGSGPSVYGIFGSEEEAAAAALSLTFPSVRTFICSTDTDAAVTEG